MDNLTHSLVGALIGQMGLKRRSGLAMPTLIVAANIPDIDATCTVFGIVSLAMRRGVTHGPIAMLLLPLALTGIVVAWDRWQTRQGTRPPDRAPVRPGWLLALAYIGCLSHPLFDWLNSYGVRLLEPFSHRWFYGDALFIVDPWVLVMLTAGLWWSRLREQAERGDWRRPAWAAFVAIGLFLSLSYAISLHAVALAKDRLTSAALFRNPASRNVFVVANPVPLRFWDRDILWRDGDRYGSGNYRLLGGMELDSSHQSPSTCIDLVDSCPPSVRYRIPRLIEKPTMTALLRIRPDWKRDPAASAFLFWSRMPVVMPEQGKLMLRDQRFMGRSIGGFAVELPPEWARLSQTGR